MKWKEYEAKKEIRCSCEEAVFMMFFLFFFCVSTTDPHSYSILHLQARFAAQVAADGTQELSRASFHALVLDVLKDAKKEAALAAQASAAAAGEEGAPEGGGQSNANSSMSRSRGRNGESSSSGGWAPSVQEMNELFDVADLDKNGTVDEEEFVKLYALGQASEKELRTRFRAMVRAMVGAYFSWTEE